MSLKENLTHKIGPLPAVAWVGGAAFIYVIYRYMKARSASTAAATTADTSPGINQDAASPWSGTDTGGGSTVVNPSSTPTNTAQTNVDWGTMAENWAIAQGFNPADVATALGSYLYQTGQSLNSTQSSILQQVLHQFGTPPEGVIIPPPTTTTPPINPHPTTTPEGYPITYDPYGGSHITIPTGAPATNPNPLPQPSSTPPTVGSTHM